MEALPQMIQTKTTSKFMEKHYHFFKRIHAICSVMKYFPLQIAYFLEYIKHTRVHWHAVRGQW